VPASEKALASVVMYEVRALSARDWNAGASRSWVWTICMSSERAAYMPYVVARGMPSASQKWQTRQKTLLHLEN
jgi:hypothetical protein